MMLNTCKSRILNTAMVCFLTLFVSQATAQTTAPPPTRTITNITGDLYRAENDITFITHVTVFLVTDEGIILADPINRDFATWLKKELDERFDVPVRYVIYSHHHFDHAEGGDVFADTARFVAHENMLRALESPLAPPPGDTYDHDGDDLIQRDEATGGIRASFNRMDSNRDDILTGAEIKANVRPWPEITYADRMTLTLGDQRVQLVHRGPGHSDDQTDLYFPEERVLFAVDYMWVKRLTGAWGIFDRTPLAVWIESIMALEGLDFDIYVPGHWEMGSKSDLVGYRKFLEDLSAEVSQGIAAGKSVEELQESITLTAYADWAAYEQQLPANIAAAYQNLTNY